MYFPIDLIIKNKEFITNILFMITIYEILNEFMSFPYLCSVGIAYSVIFTVLLMVGYWWVTPIMITSITTGDRGWLGTVALWHFAWNWLVSGGSLDIWPLFNARMRKNRPWEGLLVQVNLSMLCWSVNVLIKRSNGRTCCPKYLNLLFVNGWRLLHSRNSLIATLTNLRSHN